MPKIIFDEKEILASGDGIINASGNIYIENGRKMRGRTVTNPAFLMRGIRWRT